METYLCPAAVLTLLSMVDERRWGLRGRIVAHVAKEAARLEPGEFVPLGYRQLAKDVGASDGAVYEALRGLEDEQVLEVVHALGQVGKFGRLQQNVARWRGVPFTVDPLELLWEVGEAVRVDQCRALERGIGASDAALYGAALGPGMPRSRARHYPPLKAVEGGSMPRSRARKHTFDRRALERGIPGPNAAVAEDPTTKKERKKPISLSQGGTAISRALLRADPGGYLADSQEARIEALVAAGIEPSWAVAYIEDNARRTNAKVPALINNLEAQAAAHLERVQLQAEHRALEEEASVAWRADLEQPRFRPPGGFKALLEPVDGHNGDQAEEED